ncbi:MAG: extracellular solute-binding protein [Candidatus Izemoplasmatales bacterium]
MKKIILAILVLSFTLVLSACDSNPKLRILNWGEYINEDLVKQFEAEYNINVDIDVADSNEYFYSKIKSKTTAYDLVIPSDYMIEKMVDEEMLLEIDYTLLPNYSNVNYVSDVENIFLSMHNTTLERTSEEVNYKEYAVPYFWGTFGIIYNNRVEGLEEALNEHGWDVYFEKDTYFPEARRGMYDVPQFAYAAAMMYKDSSPNLFSDTILSEVETTIEKAGFIEWGDDNLKKNVEADNLDMAFVYTGDYLDRLYIKLDEGKTLEEVRADFDIYIPDTTMAFIDCMVIPNTATNLSGAHQFINFLLEPNNAVLNADVVGYAVTTEEAFEIIYSYLDSEDDYMRNWATANSIYYNMEVERTYYPLTTLNPDDIDAINTMIQNVIAK